MPDRPPAPSALALAALALAACGGTLANGFRVIGGASAPSRRAGSPPPGWIEVRSMRRPTVALVFTLLLVAAPARAAEPLAGKLAGRDFAPEKIVFYDRPSYQQLELVERGSADCGHDLGRHQQWLHVTPRERIAVGHTIGGNDASVVWSGASKAGDVRFELTIHAIDREARRVTGTIALAADDGTDLRGSFEARYCGTREVAVAEQKPVHGVAWNLDAAPKKLPKQPVKGWFLGAPFRPAFVTVMGYEENRSVPPAIVFYAHQPDDPCLYHWQSHDDRFVVTLDADRPLKAGLAVEKEITHRHEDGTWFEEVDAPNTISGTHAGRMAVRIDAFDKKRRVVKGRVYLAVDDLSRSLLVGAFTATYCADPTGF